VIGGCRLATVQALGTAMVYFHAMISFEDARWLDMTGGYKTHFDPRPLLMRLEADGDTTEVWHELWDELHHQGDVGEASYAAIPFLVQSYRRKHVSHWNTYAMVAMIELARKEEKNPDVPQWISDDYFQAIRILGEIGATEVLNAQPEDARAILSIIAINKGLRVHGKFLVNYSEDEMTEIESKSQ
jgi:hypothetical protein